MVFGIIKNRGDRKERESGLSPVSERNMDDFISNKRKERNRYKPTRQQHIDSIKRCVTRYKQERGMPWL